MTGMSGRSTCLGFQLRIAPVLQATLGREERPSDVPAVLQQKDSDLCSQTDLHVNSSSDTYELCGLESNVLI